MKQFINTTFLMLAILLPASLQASDFWANGLFYNIHGNEVSVAAGASSGIYSYYGDKSIPETVTYQGKTYTVTSIEAEAFSDITGALKSIRIPKTITTIGDDAFRGCALKKVYISDLAAWCRIKFTGYKANPLHIGCRLYLNDNDNEVTELIIPNTITSIGDYAFYYCKSITSISIPNSVTEIGKYAFLGCYNLTGKLNIPNSVNYIGYGAFGGTGITDVTVPNSVTHLCGGIRGGAFSHTPWFENQPDGLVYTGQWAYAYKGILPDNSNISIKEGTIGIACTAFYDGWNPQDNNGLTNINIPNSVISIGDMAFSHCKGLKTITIPNSVTSIGKRAFDECRGLEKVIIGDKVQFIASEAFGSCYNLTDVTSLAINPPTLENQSCFESYQITLHVPNSSLNSYKTANYWKDFYKIEAISSNIEEIEIDFSDSKIVQVYNITGKLLYVNQDGIDINNLKPGYYIICVETQNGLVYKQISMLKY